MQPLRIGTWNVDYAQPKNLGMLERQLEANPADIWILIETHDALRPQSHPYRHSTTQRDIAKAPGWIRDGSRWVSVSSTFPITPISGLSLKNPSATLAVKIDIPGFDEASMLIVYATALPETWTEVHIAEQAEELAELRGMYPDAALCIAGDFNTKTLTDEKSGAAQSTPGHSACDALQRYFDSLGLSRVTNNHLPFDHPVSFPLIDPLFLPSALAAKAAAKSIWNVGGNRKSNANTRAGVIIEIA